MTAADTNNHSVVESRILGGGVETVELNQLPDYIKIVEMGN